MTVQHIETELRAALRVGRDATGIVIRRAGDQAGTEVTGCPDGWRVFRGSIAAARSGSGLRWRNGSAKGPSARVRIIPAGD